MSRKNRNKILIMFVPILDFELWDKSLENPTKKILYLEKVISV